MAVTAHTLGEVCFKGPQVVITTSAKAESNTYLDHDGWLRTGDIDILPLKSINNKCALMQVILAIWIV